MKLIIDIDDKTYNDAKQFYDNMSEYECIGEYELAIANGTPLEEELEKIKAEIEEQKQDHCFDEDDMFVYITGLNNAIDIVNKYKNELKGETNDRER